jgi:hypothetical protein
MTMGTTLPLGLVTTSKATSPGATDKAIKSFLHSASTQKRINDLADGKVYAGFYYFVGNKVRTLYIPKIIQPEVIANPNGTNVSDGETWEGFLGQVSNATTRVSLDLISMDICQCILVLCPDLWDPSACFAAGDAFTRHNIAEVCPTLTPLLANSPTKYRIVKLPLCIPIVYGITQTCEGHLD